MCYGNEKKSIYSLNTVEANHSDLDLCYFRYKEKQLLPIRVSKVDEVDFVMDLLLVSNGTIHHYVLILDLMKLIAQVRGTTIRSANHLCRNCFHVCSSKEYLQQHQIQCLGNDAVAISLPNEGNNEVKFKNFAALCYSPFVCYFDLESIILPVSTAQNNPQSSSSTIIEKHEPCGYCLVVMEPNNPKPVFCQLDRGLGVMTRFVEQLEKLAMFFYNRKRIHKVYAGNLPSKQDAKTCWICQGAFESDEEKILDHCHASGRFLGWAHNNCNVNRKTLNFTPVFAHNLQNYDLHHVVKALNNCSEKTKFSIIPATDEKYI